MITYMLFSAPSYEPAGGIDDLLGMIESDSDENAIELADNLLTDNDYNPMWEWYQLVAIENGTHRRVD